jgi:hypothetical protein
MRRALGGGVSVAEGVTWVRNELRRGRMAVPGLPFLALDVRLQDVESNVWRCRLRCDATARNTGANPLG